MSTKKKIIIGVIALIVVGVILYFVFKKPKTETLNTPAPQINPGTGSTGPAINDTFPLKVGSKGENVKRLQMALNKISANNKLTIDGSFGNQTRIAIITSLATILYSLGPEVTEPQLNNIIALGNRS